MVGGQVGDGYIEIHADDKPFQREMAGVQRALRADLVKRGEALGKNLANGIGDGMAAHKAPFEKAARAAIRAFRAEAVKSATAAGRAIGDAIGDAMRDQLEQRGKIIGKQAVQAVKRAAKAAGPVTIAVDADTEKAKEKIKKLEDDLKATVEADADTKAAQAKLAWTTRSRSVDIWVDVHTARARAQIAQLVKGLSGWTLLMNWGQALTAFATNLPQTTLKIGLLYSSLASLVNPLLLLVRSIGPLVSGLWQVAKGAVAIGPAILGTVTVFGVLKAAFTELEESSNRFVKKASDNMKQWTENWVYVRHEIQKAFFESNRFNKAFAGFGRNVVFAKTFRSGLEDVSSTLSNLVSVGLESLTAALHPGATKRFFGGLVDGLNVASPGIAALARTIGIIAERGSDLFVGMGEQITRWGLQLEAWASRTDISQMARDAYEAWGAVWDLLKGMGNTVANVFNAMNPPGSALSHIERMADTWQRVADVTGGSEFQSVMRTIFDGAARGAAHLREALDPIGDNLSDFAPTLRDVLDLFGQIGSLTFTGLSDILGDFDFRGGLEAALSGVRDMVAGIDFRAVADLLGNLGRVIGDMAPMLDEFVNAFVEVANEVVQSVMPILRDFSAWAQANPGYLKELIVQLIAAKVAFAALGGAMSFATLAGMTNMNGKAFTSVGDFLGTVAKRGRGAIATMQAAGDAGAGFWGKIKSLGPGLARTIPVLGVFGTVAGVAAGGIALMAAVRMNNEARIAALEAERTTVDGYVAALKRGADNGGKYLEEINAAIRNFDSKDVGRELGTIADQLRYINKNPPGGFTEWAASLTGAKTASQQVTEELKKVDEALAGSDFSTATNAFRQIANEAGRSSTEMVTYATGYGTATEQIVNAGASLAEVARGPEFAEYRAKLVEIADAYGITNLKASDFDNWMRGKVPDAIAVAAQAAPQITAALSEADAAFVGANSSAYAMAQALADPDVASQRLSASVQTTIDRIYGLSTAQQGLSGSVSGLYSSLTNAKIASDNFNAGLSLTNAAGAANKAVLDNIAASTQNVIGQMAQQGASTKEIAAVAQSARDQFVRQYVAAEYGAKNWASASDEAKAAARRAAEEAGLFKGDYVANMIAKTTGEDQIVDIQSKITALEGERQVLLKVDTPEAAAKVKAINDEIGKLETKKTEIKADYKVGDTSAIDGFKPDPVTGLVDIKIGDDAWLRYNPKTKTGYVRVVHQPVYGKADGGIMRYFANGGFMRSVRAFASGTERHIAQIAPAGAMRVWAEPETGGEAYIPLAQSKRSRSREIWAKTGAELDMYADGGLRGAAAAAYGEGGKYIGVMTMGGLLAGIKSGAGALSAALIGPMAQALTDFRNFMGIHSDSDTMIDLGKHISSGTATGIKRGAPGVSRAVKSLIKKNIVNSADFAPATAAWRQFGADLNLALGYGMRDNGALLEEVLRGMASRASTVVDAEIERVTKLTSSANSKLSAAKKKANKAGDKALNAQIKANKAALEKQVKQLEGYKSSLDKVFDAQSGTSDLAIWWRLGEDAGAKEMANWAKGTASSITGATLGDIDKASDVLKGMLKDATSLRDSVATSLTSGFQLKGLTTIRQLTSTLSSWASRATMFAGKMKELAKKGFPAAFIQQVAALGFQDGPAVADALLAASDAEVAQVNTDWSTLLAGSTAIGNTVVDAMYGVGADAAQGFIAGIESDLDALTQAGERLGDALVAAVKKQLGIKSPSTVLRGLGVQSGEGYAEGLLSSRGLVESAMGVLTSPSALGASVNLTALGGTQAVPAAPAATVSESGGNLIINGNLIGANPKVEEAVRLLLEVIGDKRRLERSGQPVARGV